MNIRIYQINHTRDVDRLIFTGLEELEKYQGSSDVNSLIYDKVYEGDVPCDGLENIYEMFNLNRPSDFRGHSLSVSDVVEVVESKNIEKGFYFCDSFGFKKISFEADKCGISDVINNKDNKIKVLLVEPNKYPEIVEIEDNLEAMQSLVGGYIEEYMPYNDNIAIVCNEEGKMMGLPLNRAIYEENDVTDKKFYQTNRNMIDIIAGKFFICYAPPESEKYMSLPDELAKKYKEKFKFPEKFYRENGSIVAVSFKPRDKSQER